MYSDFNSFFSIQKQFSEKCKPSVSTAATATAGTVGTISTVRNPLNYNSHQSLYIFVEITLNTSNHTPKRNVFSSFLRYSTLTTMDSKNYFYFAIPYTLDIFAFYFGTQIAFKTKYTSITTLSDELAFFNYYPIAFSTNYSNLIGIFSAKSATKSIRFAYQRILQSGVYSTFSSNGVSDSAFYFNRIFVRNNGLQNRVKTRTRTLFAKKLRSIKTIRGIRLNTNSESMFKSQIQVSRFFALYKLVHAIRNSSFVLSSMILPKNIWYRNQIAKKVIRKNTSKFFTKKPTYSRVNHSIQIASRNNVINPAAIQFKLYPTEYGESIINTNKFTQFKSLISFVTHSRFSFYQLNALSLTRFAFDSKNKPNIGINSKKVSSKKKRSYYYLISIEREMISRYRYIGIYIKDLIRVCFFSRYLKKADFIASFFAFTISKLSRKRKELPFVRFLIKLFKMISSQNKDILGVRIRFQGRLNRWRRTKHILGSKGKLSFSMYANHFSYGRAQAITRKGTLGVHIWIRYQPNFSMDIPQSKSIIDYMGLSKTTAIINNLIF